MVAWGTIRKHKAFTTPIAVVLLGGLWTSSVRAQVTEDSNRIYRSAYFLGRGDTGIATADNEEAIFYNPAGIAQGKGIYKGVVIASPQIEVSQATRDLARQLSVENADAIDAVSNNIGKPNYIGITNFTGVILRRAALGAFSSGSANLLAHKAPEDGGLEVVDAGATQNLGLTFSLADSVFNEHFYVGATAKYMERGRGIASASVADADKLKDEFKDQSQFIGMGRGGGADIGLMYRLGGRLNPSFGLTVDDIGDTSIKPDKATDVDLNVKQTVNLGMAIEPGTLYSKFRLLLDVQDVVGRVEKNPRKRLHLGGEVTVKDYVGFTGGLNQGYPTIGIYTDLYFVRLDLGAYTEEIGDRVGTRPDTRYFFRLKAGF